MKNTVPQLELNSAATVDPPEEIAVLARNAKSGPAIRGCSFMIHVERVLGISGAQE
jgi:hypothetical protein